MTERNYEFRRRLAEVHRPDRRDAERRARPDEVEIGDEWSIVVEERCSPYLLQVAKDLQDYLLVSMNVSVLLCRMSDVEEASRQERTIVLATRSELPSIGALLAEPRSYRLVVEAERAIVCGFDERGAGQGSYFIEDLMNLRESPFLEKQSTIRRSRFSPRMVHSGWGLDEYPNEHLNAIAHAGMDAILIFVKDIHRTPVGHVDFNDLIDRAALYGIDVYAYSYLRSLFHPQDERAEAYYESTYGDLFDECPGLAGVILVGESCGFPSKDPRTSGQIRQAIASQSLAKFEKLLPVKREDPFSTEAFASKPNPGWWPCSDFPELLTMIRDTIRKRSAHADIVFWTYNWGYAPERERVELVRNLPEGIALMATFEMFEPIRREGITNNCVDYTISFAGPGSYFSSEAKAASERGIRLYTMSNTGGLTWDIGVIPYEPVPDQWAERHRALLRAGDDWDLCGLMESHHYGFWPSFVSELAKWAFWEPQAQVAEISARIAERDYGGSAAPLVLEAWKLWSEAIRDYVPTNEDQYGPFRIGPSYPLVFRRDHPFPASWYAMNGTRIFRTLYQPADSNRQSPGSIRFGVEIRRLTRMEERWQEGVRRLEEALALMPERKRGAGRELLGLGRFIFCSVRTTIHLKKWWQLKNRLFAESGIDASLQLLDEMKQLALAEIANAEAVIPLVEADSRLGWEPSMEYMTDAKHLHWKIAQVRSMIAGELEGYRHSIVNLTDRTV